MPKALKSFVGVFLILSLYTCSSEEAPPEGEDSPQKKVRFDLPVQGSMPKIGFAESSKDTFQLTSDVAWKVKVDLTSTSWCSVSPTSGKGTKTAVTIIVTATKANTGSATRDCTLTFTAEGVSPNPTRSVTQNSPTSVPPNRPPRFDLPAQGSIQRLGAAVNSSITFPLTSGVAWTVTDNQGWCSVSPTSGSGTNAEVTITVTATATNSSTASTRYCSLTFRATDVNPNPRRIVEQNRSRVQSILTLPASISAINGSASSMVTFSLTSNTAWRVAATPNWCSVSPISGNTEGGSSTTTVRITVTASTDNPGASRDCTLTFTATGVSSATRTVTQNIKGTFALPAQMDMPKIVNAAGSITFSLTSSVAWSVTDDQSWCSVSPAMGSASGSAIMITVTAATRNSGAASRNCTLTFSVTGVAPNPTRIVTQNKPPRFDLPVQSAITASKIDGSVNSRITFELTSSVAWTVTDNQGWCSVSPASGTGKADGGAGDETVTITVKALQENTGASRDVRLRLQQQKWPLTQYALLRKRRR